MPSTSSSRPLRVAVDVRVEQVERHAAHLHAPDLHRDGHERAVLVSELDDGAHWLGVQRHPRRIVLRVALLLPVGVGQALPEVTLAVEEADTDQRDTEVGRRLEMVAGEHAQAAGVDRQAAVESEFGREVRDPETAVLAAALPPGTTVHLGVDRGTDTREALEIVRCSRARELLVRELRDERRRVVVERREALGIEILEERARAGEPREPEVAGDRAQGLAHGGRAVE